ncbi:MAG: hypothetical protein RIC29_13730 [Rhodospirillaceae bacterium]
MCDEIYSDETLIAKGEELESWRYPELTNFSARFFYRFLPIPEKPQLPRFLYIPFSSVQLDGASDHRLRLLGAIAKWNIAWEAGQFRHEMFGPDQEEDSVHDIVPSLSRVQGQNVYLLVDSPKRFDAYLPLYSMIPYKTLDANGLPAIRRNVWPAFPAFTERIEGLLPDDYQTKLSEAFASRIWPHLISGSKLKAFEKNEPIKLLAHSLDYWLPFATSVIQNRLNLHELTEFEEDNDKSMLSDLKIRLAVEPDVIPERPRKGGSIWMGEDEASSVVKELVELADQNGQLRNLMECIKSNRVEEDFSDNWSYAKEDFERKLYRKRNKISVKFVELDYADQVVGPFSEFSDNLMFNDFFSVLNPKEREVVVCLTRSSANLSEAATELGYANHSPVSKHLKRIQAKAIRYFE